MPTVIDPALVTSHSVTLTGLNPSSNYTFTIRSRSASGKVGISTGSFRTASAAAFVLTASTGSFVLAGNVLSFSQTRVLPTTAGSIGLTGFAAGLDYVPPARVLSASTGTFALIGQPSLRQFGMPAAAGSFALTGIAATLTYGTGFDSVAELPRSTPDTTMPTITGSTFNVTVNSFSSLQAQVNAAAATAGSGNHLINVPPGTYSGQLNLPARTGSGWIVIQSTGTLPAQGTRATSADSAQMWKIRGPGNISSSRAITTSASTHHWRLVGMDFANSNGGAASVVGVVEFGNNGNQTGVDVHHFGVDRCVGTGRTSGGFDRGGVLLNCGEAFVIDSLITSFVADGTTDAKAITSYNGTGPFLIQNNELTASAECVLFGGADPGTPGRNPADITVRRNKIRKDAAWLGLGYGIKNLFECKKGIRVLIEANKFDGCYSDLSGDTQWGQCFNFISRNQDGTDLTASTRDITIRLNQITNCNMIFGSINADNNAVPSTNFSVHDNLAFNIGTYNGQAPQHPQLIQSSGASNGGVGPIVMKNNTFIGDGSVNYTWFDAGTTPKDDSLIFTDNIAITGSVTAYSRSAGGSGTTALNNTFTTYTWQNNLFIGSLNGVTHPTPNTIVANVAAAGFASATPTVAADFVATSAPSTTSGTGGARAGADVSAVITAIAGV
jgi:hypothetical protein